MKKIFLLLFLISFNMQAFANNNDLKPERNLDVKDCYINYPFFLSAITMTDKDFKNKKKSVKRKKEILPIITKNKIEVQSCLGKIEKIDLDPEDIKTILFVNTRMGEVRNMLKNFETSSLAGR